MIYLIIAIVIAMVIAPALWIMPSSRQKKQMALRHKAMAMGLQVRVCNLPQTHREQVRRQAPVQGVMYQLRWSERSQPQGSFEYRYLRADDARSNNHGLMAILAAAISHLPDSVVAVEYTNAGLAVYWREQGDIEQVDNIHQQLVALKNRLTEYNSQSGTEGERH